MAEPFKDLISKVSDEGQYDSSGVFTISADGAVGKLAEFQLPRKSAWVLKIVQAAVRARSSAIEIKQSAQTTSFRFYTTLEIQELKESLLRPELNGSDAVKHLAVGLRAVGMGAGRRFRIEVSDSSRTESLIWKGDELSLKSDKARKSKSPFVELQVEFPEGESGRALGGLARAVGTATDEYMELVRACDICPIPITLDGRRLDNLHGPREDLVHKYLYLSVAWDSFESPGLSPGFPLPQGFLKIANAWKFSDRLRDSRVFHYHGDPRQLRVHAVSKLGFSYYEQIKGKGKRQTAEFRPVSKQSRICWVSDGVVCHTEPAEWDTSPVSGQLYLSAEDLDKHLSGLNIREDARRAERIRFGMEHMLSQISELERALEKHPRTALVKTGAKLTGALGLIVAMGPVGLVKGVAGVTAVMAGASVLGIGTVVSHCRSALDRFYNSLLKKLNEDENS